MKSACAAILVTMLGVLQVSPSLADDARQKALQAQLVRINALRSQRPRDGLPVFHAAMTYSQLGQRQQALAALRELRGRRLGLIPTEGGGFDDIWTDTEFQAVRRQLMDEEDATPAAPVALRLSDAGLIPEGIAYDARRHNFFIGSVAQHKIVRVDSDSREQDFSRAGDGLDAVLGLHVDPITDRLYAISTNSFGPGGEKNRRNVVMVYSLETGTLETRFMIAEAQQLNDVTVAADGTVYCTDSAAGTLFRLRSGERTFQPLGAEAALRGANGVAVAHSGRIYVTLSTGIAGVDAQTGAAERLAQPENVVTGGVDGLYWRDGSLYGIQNWTNPGRVIRMDLSEDGSRITAVHTLQSHHHPEFNEPTTGALLGDALYVIANSQIARYQADGSFKDPATLRPTAIIAVPLH